MAIRELPQKPHSEKYEIERLAKNINSVAEENQEQTRDESFRDLKEESPKVDSKIQEGFPQTTNEFNSRLKFNS